MPTPRRRFDAVAVLVIVAVLWSIFADKRMAPLPGPKKKDLKSSVWFVDRFVDRHRLVGRPDLASGSVAGRSSGRRLAVDHLVGFADWTSISSLFLRTLVVVVDKTRAARSLAEGLKKAKHIFYAHADFCTEMQRYSHRSQNRQTSELELSYFLCSSSEFLYILFLLNQKTQTAEDWPLLIGAKKRRRCALLGQTPCDCALKKVMPGIRARR
jgi:hypothetical protein